MKRHDEFVNGIISTPMTQFTRMGTHMKMQLCLRLQTSDSFDGRNADCEGIVDTVFHRFPMGQLALFNPELPPDGWLSSRKSGFE
jgi:hypothetical protein